ncbi:hypothetical protein L0B53_01455 [Vibrio sp. SS-MA-C1-2]|uniref:hypothetical protein n=1 Tax=Vibrio sp. SS-MA-C1-2 TaxID=2908646 RepID=UPI001F1DFA8D|nr:hypothetical protein [Vibrio sp. SS-MA-C1-2]UJF17463.1 hypothetical protein L0B53_01455 [Vibrio sp. SS-MA-C1-2]
MMNKTATFLLLSVLSFGSFAANESGMMTQKSNEIAMGIGFDRGLGGIIEYKKNKVSFGNDGIAYDYRLATAPIGDDSHSVLFDWYIGVGGWADWDDGFGPRVPIGIEADFQNNLRAYFQVNPGVDLESNVDFDVSAAFGVTYRF